MPPIPSVENFTEPSRPAVSEYRVLSTKADWIVGRVWRSQGSAREPEIADFRTE